MIMTIMTAFRYSRTAQPKQYESVVIEAQGVPGEGQNANDALDELTAFVDSKVVEACARVNGAAPPLAKPSKAQQVIDSVRSYTRTADPITPASPAPLATGNAGNGSSSPVPSASDPPFDVDSAPAAEPGAKPKRGRKPKNATISIEEQKNVARAEFEKMIASESLEQLAERFNKFRDPAKGYVELLTTDQWEQSVINVHARYKALMSTTADPKIMNTLIAAIAGERNIIDQKRAAAA